MLHIFGFILIVIIVLIVIGLSIIGHVLRTIFGWFRRLDASRRNAGNGQRDYTASSQTRRQPSDENAAHPKRKKIFGDDEGEYVDFEEIE